MRITHSPTTPPDEPPTIRCGRGQRILARSTLALVVSAGVLAAAGSAGAEPASVLAVAGSFDEVLNNLRNWLVGILALIATVCLTIGGARYLVCSGDPGEVERAKIALKAACIGYALAMLAPVVVAVLKSIVGG
ncbi:pilin [Nocardia vulneris]|uniref:pilin n=1 Tax=Nocardia vulneris TaxID=1141657 RepID=UPI0009E4A20D|nr:pilin [Nocardia vulneris]